MSQIEGVHSQAIELQAPEIDRWCNRLLDEASEFGNHFEDDQGRLVFPNLGGTHAKSFEVPGKITRIENVVVTIRSWVDGPGASDSNAPRAAAVAAAINTQLHETMELQNLTDQA